jgi:hypothetical protein
MTLNEKIAKLTPAGRSALINVLDGNRVGSQVVVADSLEGGRLAGLGFVGAGGGLTASGTAAVTLLRTSILDELL